MILAKRPLAALAAAAFCAALPAGAEQSNNESWTATLLFENDLFGDSDRYYTNGVKLSWISPDLTEYRDAGRLPEWILPLVERLPFINEPDTQRNVTLALGQQIYTPEDIQAVSLLPNDRPYAGWLYVAAAFHSRTAQRLDAMEIQLGVVGPASLAEQAQNLVHELRGIPTAKGWDHQLDNEPGIGLIYERKWRMIQGRSPAGFGFDVIGHAGGALGNVAIYANAGAEIRAGWNLPSDFGLALIRPAGDASAPLDASDPRLAAQRRFGAHVFAAVSGRLVGHDIFLDGNTFSDSHSVDQRTLVGDLIAGLSMLIGDVKISYAQVFRTREFERQRKLQNFGSISLSLTF